jgi:hypothetical protein
MTMIFSAGALALGFTIGLFAFKVKTRWCKRCGATLICAFCVTDPQLAMMRGGMARSRRRGGGGVPC